VRKARLTPPAEPVPQSVQRASGRSEEGQGPGCRGSPPEAGNQEGLAARGQREGGRPSAGSCARIRLLIDFMLGIEYN